MESAFDRVQYWLSITFLHETDYLHFNSLLEGFRRKEMFEYLAKTLIKRVPYVICTSGWAHVKVLDFISTHFEILRSMGKEIKFTFHILSPLVSKIVTISLPLMTCVTKDYFRTSEGTFTVKPTLQDVIFTENNLNKVTSTISKDLEKI